MYWIEGGKLSWSIYDNQFLCIKYINNKKEIKKYSKLSSKTLLELNSEFNRVGELKVNIQKQNKTIVFMIATDFEIKF